MLALKPVSLSFPDKSLPAVSPWLMLSFPFVAKMDDWQHSNDVISTHDTPSTYCHLEILEINFIDITALWSEYLQL